MATMTPAYVRGRVTNGYAYFVEDERGNLVDIEYVCQDCHEIDNAIPWWPAFDFGEYGAYCKRCDRRID